MVGLIESTMTALPLASGKELFLVVKSGGGATNNHNTQHTTHNTQHNTQ